MAPWGVPRQIGAETPVDARVDLEQLAEPLPPRPRGMLGPRLPPIPPPLGGADPRLGQDAVERGIANLDPLLLEELLPEVGEVEARVLPAAGRDNRLLGGLAGLPCRGSTLVPVAERLGPSLRVGPLQPVHVLPRCPEPRRRMPRRQPPGDSLPDGRCDVLVAKSLHAPYLRGNVPHAGVSWKQVTR